MEYQKTEENPFKYQHMMRNSACDESTHYQPDASITHYQPPSHLRWQDETLNRQSWGRRLDQVSCSCKRLEGVRYGVQLPGVRLGAHLFSGIASSNRTSKAHAAGRWLQIGTQGDVTGTNLLAWYKEKLLHHDKHTRMNIKCGPPRHPGNKGM